MKLNRVALWVADPPPANSIADNDAHHISVIIDLMVNSIFGDTVTVFKASIPIHFHCPLGLGLWGKFCRHFLIRPQLLRAIRGQEGQKNKMGGEDVRQDHTMGLVMVQHRKEIKDNVCLGVAGQGDSV